MPQSSQKKLNSGFHAKSEAAEVMTGIDLTGKVAIVTGGYSGIGLETTRALVNAGAKVYVPARSMNKAKENLSGIKCNSDAIEIIPMDLGDLESVKALAAQIAEKETSIDLLINNAGIMACPETRIGKGWESQFATNHLGHFTLTTQLLPQLLNAEKPRVVCLSSIAHRRTDVLWDDIHFNETPYEKWTAYAQAKSANALFALGLDLKYRDKGVRAFSVHPGGILTPLQRHLENEEMIALGWTNEQGELSEQAKAMFKSTTQGCSTTLWAATSSQLDGLGGLYCEDGDVANIATDDSPRYLDVAPWAVDEQGAVRLWELTEAMLA